MAAARSDRRKIAEKRNHRNVTETRLLWLMSPVVRPLAIGGRDCVRY